MAALLLGVICRVAAPFMRRLPVVLVLGYAVVVTIVLGGCSSAASTPGVVDGWGIGGPFTCSEPEPDPDRPCSVLLPLAEKALDHRDPSHAAVVSAGLYGEGPDASGNWVVRSSIVKVAVFRLADNTVRAIGVGYPGIATTPWTIDYGP